MILQNSAKVLYKIFALQLCGHLLMLSKIILFIDLGKNFVLKYLYNENSKSIRHKKAGKMNCPL